MTFPSPSHLKWLEIYFRIFFVLKLFENVKIAGLKINIVFIGIEWLFYATNRSVSYLDCFQDKNCLNNTVKLISRHILKWQCQSYRSHRCLPRSDLIKICQKLVHASNIVSNFPSQWWWKICDFHKNVSRRKWKSNASFLCKLMLGFLA